MDVEAFFRSQGRFLRAEDISQPVVVTMERWSVERMGSAPAGSRVTEKLCLWFRGADRGLLLNRTNASALAEILDSPECDDWIGKRVELFVDETVANPSGTNTGGIRVRAPSSEAIANEEVPF